MRDNKVVGTRSRDEGGFALVAIVVILIPLVIAAGAFSTIMATRNNELGVEHDEELALLTAEAGVDDAIFRGRTGTLTSGDNYERTLGVGRSFRVEPTHLLSDAKDNDLDGLTDEADEDVFQVIVTGRYRGTARRIAAYLGPVPLLPVLGSAMATADPAVGIKLQGTPLLSGFDVNMDGTSGVGPDVPGLSISSPGTIAHLMSELSPPEQASVVGLGGPPSLGVTPAVDVATIVAQVKNIANLVLTSDKYPAYNFGNGPTGVANIAYREGDVKFMGNSQGAGILVVTGDLEMAGTFRFDGVIIVLGKLINAAGTADVFGAVLQGGGGALIDTKGTFTLNYSSEAIALANSLSGRYVSFNGWQEISRK